MTNRSGPAWPSTFSIYHFPFVISRFAAGLEALERRALSAKCPRFPSNDIAVAVAEDKRVSAAVDGEHSSKENLAAIGRILPTGQLSWRVADPAHRRYKDHSHRGKAREHLRIVTGPGRKAHRPEACRGGLARNEIANPRGCKGGLVSAGSSNVDSGPAFARNLPCPRLDALVYLVDLLEREVAQLDDQIHLSGNDIRRSWRDRELPYSPDLPPGFSHGLVAHGKHQARGSDQGVPPLRHRRRTRVICEACDLRMVAIDPDN